MQSATTTIPTTAMFWNIWGHREPMRLAEYLQQRLRSVDVFALTEVTSAPLLAETWPLAYTHNNPKSSEPPAMMAGAQHLVEHVFTEDYAVKFAYPEKRDWECVQTGTIYADVAFGSVLAYRYDALEYVEDGHELIIDGNEYGVTPRVLQWLVFKRGSFTYLFCHLHGAWIADNTKGDHPVRERQSFEVLETIHSIVHSRGVDKVIFGGDLNLDINTDALKQLEEGHPAFPGLELTNQVRRLGFENTRTPRYRKYGVPGESKHADHVLTGPGVVVDRMTIDNDAMASDHAPLVVKFH